MKYICFLYEFFLRTQYIIIFEFLQYSVDKSIFTGGSSGDGPHRQREKKKSKINISVFFKYIRMKLNFKSKQ